MEKLKKPAICFIVIILYGIINLEVMKETVSFFSSNPNYSIDPSIGEPSNILIYLLLYIPLNYLINKFLLVEVVKKGDEHKLGIILNFISIPLFFIGYLFYLFIKF